MNREINLTVTYVLHVLTTKSGSSTSSSELDETTTENPGILALQKRGKGDTIRVIVVEIRN